MLSRLKYDLTMAEAARAPGGSRVDLLVVADMVQRGARVLDVGCGDGELLRLLESRGVDGRGIELSREGVALRKIADLPFVIQADAPHAPEHALEVELPFLQTVLASFQVVPLVVGDAAPQNVAYVLRQLWGGQRC
jgi:SAM-dependent methyltransferase